MLDNVFKQWIQVKKASKTKGFTLVELLVVMGLFALLASFATISLLRPQTKSSLSTVASVLISDLRQQQLKSMAGASSNEATSQPYGIYFDAARYVLFHGATYSAEDPSNFEIDLEGGVMFSQINFPSSQIVFLEKSGEISDFIDGSNTVVLRSVSGEEIILSVNRYGVVTLLD